MRYTIAELYRTAIVLLMIVSFFKMNFMAPEKIWANLTVSDLERTTKFYTQMGFRHNGANKELTSFFFGENDFVIHFFLKEVLKANTGVDMSDAQHSNEIMFTLSAESREEVDTCAKEVATAGGKVVSQPKAFGEGYYGFVFADPDGHLFNVFYM